MKWSNLEFQLASFSLYQLIIKMIKIELLEVNYQVKDLSKIRNFRHLKLDNKFKINLNAMPNNINKVKEGKSWKFNKKII